MGEIRLQDLSVEDGENHKRWKLCTRNPSGKKILKKNKIFNLLDTLWLNFCSFSCVQLGRYLESYTS
jgi:hypothetical protein